MQNSGPSSSDIPSVMKAVVFSDFGQPESALSIPSDVPVPSPSSSQVLVRVHAASINPIDYKVMGGILSIVSFLQKWPLITGFDFSGVVVQAGSSCKLLKIGDKVYGKTVFPKCGALAEYVAIEENIVSIKPKNLTFAQAATVPLAGLTSYQALLHSGKLKEGQKVLINGSSGGTGIFGVQIAKQVGATVYATCSERNRQLVEELGADRIIDYQKQDFGDELKDEGIDLVYDTVGGYDAWEKAQKILKPSGIFVTIAGDKQEKVGVVSISSLVSKIVNRTFWGLVGSLPTYKMVALSENKKDLEAMKDMLESGSVKTVVEKVYPLDQSVEAFNRLMTSRVVGKLSIGVHNEDDI
eukprot:TRINITY_DN5407_c0_g1_i1.p1 TRINITY_DN5407_c0_g1~~TRINITY_DN5407_c0_g1_i1.p1  ORF type:complete len:362 (-),score=105.09 TRINITY_DN5407_c0_g1_i1:27-1088(-)